MIIMTISKKQQQTAVYISVHCTMIIIINEWECWMEILFTISTEISDSVDYGSVIVIRNDATPHTVMCAIYNELTKFSIEQFPHHRDHIDANLLNIISVEISFCIPTNCLKMFCLCCSLLRNHYFFESIFHLHLFQNYNFRNENEFQWIGRKFYRRSDDCEPKWWAEA